MLLETRLENGKKHVVDHQSRPADRANEEPLRHGAIEAQQRCDHYAEQQRQSRQDCPQGQRSSHDRSRVGILSRDIAEGENVGPKVGQNTCQREIGQDRAVFAEVCRFEVSCKNGEDNKAKQRLDDLAAGADKRIERHRSNAVVGRGRGDRSVCKPGPASGHVRGRPVYLE